MSEDDIEEVLAEMRKWSEYLLGHKKLPMLQVDDAFHELVRANGFYEAGRPVRDFGETQQDVDTFRRREAFDGIGRRIHPKDLELDRDFFYLRWRVAKDIEERDCIFVELHRVVGEGIGAKYRERLKPVTQVAVPLEVLAEFLGPLRDPAFVERGRVTREFLAKMGLVEPTARAEGADYVLGRREVWDNNMPKNPRFWRAMLESFAVFFPRGPVIAAVPAAASAPARPAPPAVAQGIQSGAGAEEASL